MNALQYEFGMVGLGVMGRNLMLNIADKGFPVIGLDLDPIKTAAVESEATPGTEVKATTELSEFVQSLRKPRALMLLVPAGSPVDAAIATLLPHLEAGDIVIDGGNSYFTDTERRVLELEPKGIHFFGMGISGGEKGARRGPSMMPGGNRAAYERLRPIFEAVAAKVDGEPCVDFLGNGSAGNYVKMVHNGIEYGIMQLIAEAYDVLKRGAMLNDEALQQTFEQWNQTELQSYLIEITGEILKYVDPTTGRRLVDVISDQARSKGTGKWTSQNAMDLQVAVPTIDMSVLMRDLSKYKEQRVQAAANFPRSASNAITGNSDFVNDVRQALYGCVLLTYTQGMAQLVVASETYKYGLNLAQVAKVWRGGCIIRAACLSNIRTAFEHQPGLQNLLLDPAFGAELAAPLEALRRVLKAAVDSGIAVPGFMASLAYFDAYSTANLPTNLIQAQRDYFGAHTYERVDMPGTFHTSW